MSYNPIELATGVAAMLVARAIDGDPQLSYVPVIERDAVDDLRVFVVPGNIDTTIIARDGERAFSPLVDIAVVQACRPDDTEAIADLIAFAQSVGDLAALYAPLDPDGTEIPAAPITINHDPLYSVEQLRSGVFLGVIRVEYEL